MQYARLSATVLVVLIVLLAGCSGGGTGTDGTPTVATTAAGEATGDSTQPAAEDTAFDATDASQQLRDAGSFTTTWSYSVTDVDGATTSVTDTYRVNLDANRSIELFATDGPEADSETTTFIADGTGYTRVEAGGQTLYQTNDQPPAVFESATGRASSLFTFVESDIQYVGTETYDGVTVDRYEYSDASAWSEYNENVSIAMFSSDTEVTVTSFSVVVLVDEDGVGRLTTWTLAGEAADGTPVSAEWSYSLTDIGSTTVEDPDWLADAQAQ